MRTKRDTDRERERRHTDEAYRLSYNEKRARYKRTRAKRDPEYRKLLAKRARDYRRRKKAQRLEGQAQGSRLGASFLRQKAAEAI